MPKKLMVLGAFVALPGCQCLPKCWLCGVGEALADTIFGPTGVVGSLISGLIGGIVPA